MIITLEKIKSTRKSACTI